VVRQLTKITDTNLATARGVISGDGRFVYTSVEGEFTSTYGIYRYDVSDRSQTLEISTGEGTGGGIGIILGDVLSSLEGIGGYTITSIEAARGALASAKASIDNLAKLRGVLGAGAARLEAAGRVLSSQGEVLTAANARVIDADTAEVSAQYTRVQILRNVASSVLAQANQQPELAITLLRG
jgi:flagellin